MKYSFVILVGFCLTFATADSSAVSCSVIDYLYYSSDCCDSSNTVQSMESIPQTDKAAIDNLASLKRPDRTACRSGDNIKFLASKIVCADDDTCMTPCINGNITGTVAGNNCLCTCNLGYQGVDCGTVTPCSNTCQNSGVVNGTVAGGDCGCDCSATNFIGTECQTPIPLSFVLHADGTTFSTAKILTSQECFDNQAAILTAVLTLRNDTTTTAWNEPIGADATAFGNTRTVSYVTRPKGCYVSVKTTDSEYDLRFNGHADGADPGVDGLFVNYGINK